MTEQTTVTVKTTTEDNHIEEDNDREEKMKGRITTERIEKRPTVALRNEEHHMEVDNQAIPDDCIHMEDAEREGPSRSQIK